MENRQTERLSLSVSAEIRLKSKRVNRRHERLDYVERRTRHRCILGNVTPTQYIDIRWLDVRKVVFTLLVYDTALLHHHPLCLQLINLSSTGHDALPNMVKDHSSATVWNDWSSLDTTLRCTNAFKHRLWTARTTVLTGSGTAILWTARTTQLSSTHLHSSTVQNQIQSK